VSSAPVAAVGDKEFYDLVGTIDVLKKILLASVINGFELQLEPEWDSQCPPLTDRDFADWTQTPKYTAHEVASLLKKAALPILSVHASRDIGNYLCSVEERDWKKGRQDIWDALYIAEELGAGICVFHLWDTWAKKFDLNRVQNAFREATKAFPRVKASCENIPTQMPDYTPFSLARLFDYVTLDIRWAALYNEFDSFKGIIDKVVNVHMRGKLADDKWILERSSYGFYDALRRLVREWRYEGLLTIEPEGMLDGSRFDEFIRAMKTLDGVQRLPSP
jgi:sugar phosphate isomerase/epimerase